MNYLLQGVPGSGKTFASLAFPEPVVLFLIENRAKFYTEVKDKFFPNRMISIISCHVAKDIKNKWLSPTDEVQTFKAFEKEFTGFDITAAGTVVIDDVGLLRKCGGEVYKADNNKKSVPIEQGWGWVNDKIRYFILGAMNACTVLGKTCVVTTTMKDNYKVLNGEHVKDGTIPDVIRDIVTNIDYQIEMKGQKQTARYLAQVIKSPYGSMTLDITGKSLYNMLKEVE